MRGLRDDPRPGQSKNLDHEMYRLRVGEYRIVYAVFDGDQVVYIGKVARRLEKIYREVTQLLLRARQEVESGRGRQP